MKVVTCPVAGCGRTIGVLEPPAAQRNAVLRTRPHRNLAGKPCQPVPVKPEDVRDEPRLAHRREGKAVRQSYGARW